MENKFLNYIESEDENTSLSELEKNKARNLFNIIKSSIPNLETNNCEHDIEDICAFVEGNLKDREIIEDRIFSCDSCFETYTFLKKEINTIDNLTPQYFKDKVYQKDEKVLRKNTLWHIFKTNKLIKYSSGALAATFLLFFTINPLDTDMSDFHNSQKSQQDISVPAPAVNSNNQSKKSEIKEDKSTNNNIQSESGLENDIKPVTPPIIREKTILPQVTVSKPKISRDKKINQDPNKVSKPKKLTENFSVPDPAIISSEKRNNSVLTLPTEKEIINSKTIERRSTSVEEPKNNMDSATITAPRVEISKPSIIQAPVSAKNRESQPSSNFEIFNGSENQSNQSTLKKEETNNAIPAAPVQKDIKDKYNDDENKAENIEPLKQKAVPKTQLRLKDSPKKISINFQIKEKGFVIIKDKKNTVIGKSLLLNPGHYNNFILDIENTSEDYSQYIYTDSNNNGFFDLEDKLSP